VSKGEDAAKLFEAAIGETEGTGDWLEVTQDRINAFADITEDHQFIHVDPEACKELSPWGVPIAHGFLTLSLLVKLSSSIPMPPERLDGIVMGVNYGFDKIRFINPVKANSSACIGCHVTAPVSSHALANTTPIGESCVICHGSGATFAVDKVHAQY